MSEKTQEATPQKRADARKKGQLASSRPLTQGAATIGAIVGLVLGQEVISERLQVLTVRLLGTSTLAPSAALSEALKTLAACVLWPAIGAVLGAVIAGLTTAGLTFNPTLVQLKPERLNPAEGLKKLFSKARVLETLRSLAYAAVILIACWRLMAELAQPALRLSSLSGPALTEGLLQTTRPVLTRALLGLGLVGLFDFWLAKRRHRKELMMSHQDVKQEHKSSEGDPHHKAKRKAAHKQLTSGGPARGAKAATAVVVNPTHIAVAIRYEPEECEAPYIVARGRDDDALEIRREAAAHGVPIVKDIPLARGLIHYELGEEVPEELYQAAAAVLRVAIGHAQCTQPPHERTT